METARHAVIIKELFQYRVRVGWQGFRQDTIARAGVAFLIDINVMSARCEGTVFRIFPALRVQILQYGAAIGGGITIFTVANAMAHRAAHIVHNAGGHRFDAGIHRGIVQRHAAPAADAEQADSVAIHFVLQS